MNRGRRPNQGWNVKLSSTFKKGHLICYKNYVDLSVDTVNF